MKHCGHAISIVFPHVRFKNIHRTEILHKMQSSAYSYTVLHSGITKLYSTGGSGSIPTKIAKTFTVAVEGNIGSGKSFFLDNFAKCTDVDIIPEPVAKWRNVRGHNLLGLMYKESSRWALTFQTYVQLNMLQQHLSPHVKPIKMMERSIFSAKYCFVENLHQSGKMSDLEYVVLSEWFDWIIRNNNIHIDLIVYLRASPETVYRRIQERSRKEESTISMDYLKHLHNLHDDWLVHRAKFTLPAPVLVLDANDGQIEMFEQYENHKKEMFFGYSR